jgi:hypothetical protein
VREANRALVEQLAATSIQKIFRGHFFRQEKKRLKDKQENVATLIIQRCWRGFHQRNTNFILKRQRAATVIQSIYRTRLVHKIIKRFNKLSGAALPIGLALQAEALKKASVNVPMSEYTDLLTTIAAVHAKLTEKVITSSQMK